MSKGRDVNDAGAMAGHEGRQEQAGEREMAQVIGADLQLEALGSAAVGDCHDPGVVDEQVEAVGVCQGPLTGEFADRCKAGEVE